MAQGDGMPRLELIFLYLASGGGCFRWRDEDCSPSMSMWRSCNLARFNNKAIYYSLLVIPR